MLAPHARARLHYRNFFHSACACRAYSHCPFLTRPAASLPLPPPTSSPSSNTPQAQAQISAQLQQNLLDKMGKVCYKRCVTGATEKLTDRQRRCLDACTSSFLEGFEVASDTLTSIMKKQAAAAEHD